MVLRQYLSIYTYLKCFLNFQILERRYSKTIQEEGEGQEEGGIVEYRNKTTKSHYVSKKTSRFFISIVILCAWSVPKIIRTAGLKSFLYVSHIPQNTYRGIRLIKMSSIRPPQTKRGYFRH